MSLELCSGVYFLLLWQAWLCGGSVEILPCSRVGHIYQNQEAQSPFDQEATLRNKVRIAETWLGSFKETFYRHSPEALSLSKVRRDPGRGSWAHHGAASRRLGQGVPLPPACMENKSFRLVLPLSRPSQVAPQFGRAARLSQASPQSITAGLGLQPPEVCGMASKGCDPVSQGQSADWAGNKQ